MQSCLCMSRTSLHLKCYPTTPPPGLILIWCAALRSLNAHRSVPQPIALTPGADNDAETVMHALISCDVKMQRHGSSINDIMASTSPTGFMDTSEPHVGNLGTHWPGRSKGKGRSTAHHHHHRQQHGMLPQLSHSGRPNTQQRNMRPLQRNPGVMDMHTAGASSASFTGANTARGYSHSPPPVGRGAAESAPNHGYGYGSSSGSGSGHGYHDAPEHGHGVPFYSFLIFVLLWWFFGPVDARKTWFGRCVVVAAYAAVVDSARYTLCSVHLVPGLRFSCFSRSAISFVQ